MGDVFKKIEEHNPSKKPKILIVLNDVLTDLLSNRKLNPVVTELFVRWRKWNISLVFTAQSCFALQKNIRLSFTHYLL